jgi:AcrR family transcriptional regulator
MSTPTTPGLRERKKARTRWTIQEHALRLFAEQGYESTTVEQIATAAEISPSTFFRYFPTKEDVVVQDEFDDLLIEAFRTAGAAQDPLGSLRRTLLQAVEKFDQNELAKSRQRTELTLSVPALRARTVQNVLDRFNDAVAGFAEGSGLPTDDLGAQVFVGAVIGGFMPVLLDWYRSGYQEDPGALLDRALDSIRSIVTPR